MVSKRKVLGPDTDDLAVDGTKISTQNTEWTAHATQSTKSGGTGPIGDLSNAEEFLEHLNSAHQRMAELFGNIVTYASDPFRIRQDFELAISCQNSMLRCTVSLMNLWAMQAPKKTVPAWISVGRSFKLSQLRQFEDGSPCVGLQEKAATWAQSWKLATELLVGVRTPSPPSCPRISREQFNQETNVWNLHEAHIQLASETHLNIIDTWQKALSAYWSIVIVEPPEGTAQSSQGSDRSDLQGREVGRRPR